MKVQKTQTRRSFLEFIVEKGILSQEQLEELVSDIGEIPETRLREALSGRYMIPEEEVYVAWAEYLGLPYIDLRLIAFDTGALTMIPSEFARQNCLIPFSFYPGEISVAFDDLGVDVIDQLKKQTGCDVLIHIAMRSRILEAIEVHYGAIDIEMAAKEAGLSLHSADMLGSREAAEIGPVVDISEGIIVNALKHRASDIHIEPREDHLQIRFRIDGVLHDRYKLERNIASPLVSRYKIMAKLDIAEKRIPQDGRIQDVFGGRHIDIRMSVIPTIYGEKVVLRILDKSGVSLDIGEMLFSRQIHHRIMKVISAPHGVFFVTGPTGSGKTTTLYAVLNYINSTERNIVTIEDPIEYQLPLINQIQVNYDIGLNFPKALRSVLRQDPDVIMVGEIRDLETAKVSTEAALTGHLVLSTLHTNNSIDAILRLVEIGVESFMVAPSLIGILSQRLVRRVCRKCKEEYVASAEEMRYFGVPPTGPKIKLFRGRGCSACMGTGYSGRLAIHELVVINDEIRELIFQKATSDRVAEACYRNRYRSMRFDGLKKSLRGLTTLSEVLRVTTAQEDFLLE